MPIRDRDVDIRREVPPVQLRREVLEHVEGVCVDVELVADIDHSASAFDAPRHTQTAELEREEEEEEGCQK